MPYREKAETLVADGTPDDKTSTALTGSDPDLTVAPRTDRSMYFTSLTPDDSPSGALFKIAPLYHVPTPEESQRMAELGAAVDKASAQTGVSIPAVTIQKDGLGSFYSTATDIGVTSDTLRSRDFASDFGGFALRHETSHFHFNDYQHNEILGKISMANMEMQNLSEAIRQNPQFVYENIRDQWGSTEAFERYLGRASNEIFKVSAHRDLMASETPINLAEQFSNPQNRIALGNTLESISPPILDALQTGDNAVTSAARMPREMHYPGFTGGQDLPPEAMQELTRLDATYLQRHTELGKDLYGFSPRFKTAVEFTADEFSLRTSDNPRRDITAYTSHALEQGSLDPDGMFNFGTKDYHPSDFARLERMRSIGGKLESGTLLPLNVKSDITQGNVQQTLPESGGQPVLTLTANETGTPSATQTPVNDIAAQKRPPR